MNFTIILISIVVFILAALGLSVGIIAGRREPKGKCLAADCACDGDHTKHPEGEPHCDECPNG